MRDVSMIYYGTLWTWQSMSKVIEESIWSESRKLAAKTTGQ